MLLCVRSKYGVKHGGSSAASEGSRDNYLSTRLTQATIFSTSFYSVPSDCKWAIDITSLKPRWHEISPLCGAFGWLSSTRRDFGSKRLLRFGKAKAVNSVGIFSSRAAFQVIRNDGRLPLNGLIYSRDAIPEYMCMLKGTLV